MIGTEGWPRVGSRSRRAPLAAVTILIIGAAAAAPAYTGTFGPYVLFHAACILLALSAFLRPVSYGFTTLSIFLLLGFWVKVCAALFGVPVLIEPTGSFDGSAESWDRTLLFSAAGLAGLALPRAVLYFRPSYVATERRRVSVPAWYLQRRGVIWAITGVALVGGAYVNWRFRLYMVGVHELVVLPFRLNAALAWWYTAGAGLWIAALLEWERRINGNRPLALWLLVPLAEALMTSVVTLSRGAYLMKVLPYGLVLARRPDWLRLPLRHGSAAGLLSIVAIGFVVSLAGVSWLRILTYPSLALPPAESASVSSGRQQPATADGPRLPGLVPSQGQKATRNTAEARARELGRMILGRWIGLEGVLAVAGSSHVGFGLLRAGLVEDPARGNAALYQQLSRASYKPLSGFTFLTVPGVIAVLGYSGSCLIILLGMCLAGSVMLGTDVLIQRLFDNDLLCAVAGVAFANALAQMNFPYLTLVFFIELLATVAALWAVHQHRRTTPA